MNQQPPRDGDDPIEIAIYWARRGQIKKALEPMANAILDTTSVRQTRAIRPINPGLARMFGELVDNRSGFIPNVEVIGSADYIAEMIRNCSSIWPKMSMRELEFQFLSVGQVIPDDNFYPLTTLVFELRFSFLFSPVVTHEHRDYKFSKLFATDEVRELIKEKCPNLLKVIHGENDRVNNLSNFRPSRRRTLFG